MLHVPKMAEKQLQMFILLYFCTNFRFKFFFTKKTFKNHGLFTKIWFLLIRNWNSNGFRLTLRISGTEGTKIVWPYLLRKCLKFAIDFTSFHDYQVLCAPWFWCIVFTLRLDARNAIRYKKKFKHYKKVRQCW